MGIIVCRLWNLFNLYPVYSRDYIRGEKFMEDFIEKIGAVVLIILMIAVGVLTVGAVCFVFSLFLPL